MAAYKPRSGRGFGPKKVGKAKPGAVGGLRAAGLTVGKPGTLGKYQAKPNLGNAPEPSAPAPSPRPAVTGQRAVPDSTYNNRVDLAERRGKQRLGELQGQETDIKHEFGIEDPTNPFSRANALKNAFLARRKAASAGLASQGQLYSGAHERALSRTRREEEQSRHELRRAYEQAIGAIGSARAGVKFDTEEQKAQAFEDWLARAPEPDVALPEEEAPAAPAPARAAPKPPAMSPGGRPIAPGPPVPIGSGPQGGAQPSYTSVVSKPKAKPKGKTKVGTVKGKGKAGGIPNATKNGPGTAIHKAVWKAYNPGKKYPW